MPWLDVKMSFIFDEKSEDFLIYVMNASLTLTCLFDFAVKCADTSMLFIVYELNVIVV